MPLHNPRFRRNPQLKNAAMNTPLLRKGAKGQGVHVLQFALLDMGWALPKSMGTSTGGSPDGKFGPETEEAVKQFQDHHNLKPDGIVGPNTMGAFDHYAPGYTHRVTLHFRSIAMNDVGFEPILQKARDCYDQYGIKLIFGSGSSLLLEEAQQQLFRKIDQECNWKLTTGEYNQLHALGPPVPPNHVKIYFVNDMKDVVGCGGHAPGRPAATVGKRAGAVDLGHELGHVLLGATYRPVHHPHAINVMNATGRNEPWTWIFTHGQVTQIRKHKCCEKM